MNLLLLVPNLGGVLIAAVFALNRVKGVKDFPRAFYLSTLIVIFFFLIYAEVIIAGTFGLLHPLPLTLFNGAVLLAAVCFRPALFPRLFSDLRAMISEQFLPMKGRALKAYLWLIVLLLGLYIVKPIDEGDSLIYHLPNAMYFVNTHSTSSFIGEWMHSEGSPAAYFTRGMEAIYSFFFLFSSSTIPVLLLKFLLLFLVFFCLLDYGGGKRTAALLCLILFSSYLFRSDLESLKNDLMIGALLLYLFVSISKYREKIGALLCPILFSLALIAAVKSNGFIYVLPIAALTAFLLPAKKVRFLAVAAPILLGLGFYFFLLNIRHFGSPLYPYQVSLFGRTIFSGETSSWTLLVFSAGPALIPPLARGLIRVSNPLMVLALPAAFIFLLISVFRPKTSRRNPDTAVTLFFVVLSALFFLLHPLFGEREQWHHHLYFGGVLRYAFGLILIGAALFARAFRRAGRAESRMAFGATLTLCLMNLVWYHLAAYRLKPEVAFSDYAAVFQSFDNNLLLALTTVFYLAAALVVASKRRKILVPIFLLACLAYSLAVYPRQLTYSGFSKSLGLKSDIFEILPRIRHPEKSVAVSVSFQNATFLLHEPLYAYFNRVKSFRRLEEADGHDYIIIGKDRIGRFADDIYGQVFEAVSLEYEDEETVLSGYRLIHRDPLYRVYQIVPAGT